MRHFIAFALLATACSPAPTQGAAAPAPQTEAPSAANADARALQQTPAPGQWTATTEDVFAASYGAPGTGAFSIMCSGPGAAITLNFGYLQAPRAAALTSLRLITATHTLELPAHSRDDGVLHATIAENASEHDPLITVLGAPNDTFAVDVAGAITVFPWDDALRTTLSACRSDEPRQLPTPGPR